MQNSKIYEWVTQNQNRKDILINSGQPLTAKQLGRKTGIPNGMCSYLLKKFAARQLCVCLNPDAGNCRLYSLTELGQKIQNRLKKEMNLPITDTDPIFDDIDWHLYGWICYNQRSLVLRSLTQPMQPSEIRRNIRHRFPLAKISSNNIRDVIHLFEKHDIVKRVYLKKKAHPRYELTDIGWNMQRLLHNAEIQA